MSQTINRNDFLKLTITFATLSAATVVGCGDDEDSPPGGGGTDAGGAGGDAESGSGGKAGSGTSGSGGKAGSGTGGTGGTGGTAGGGGTGGGDAGAGAGGEGGLGGGGAGGEGGGLAGEGGGAGEGFGGGGAGGEGGGPVAALQCEGLTMTHAGGGHTHLTDAAKIALTAYINGPSHVVDFPLPADGGPSHIHQLRFTQGEIDTLLGGGTVNKAIVADATGHSHSYTITCA